MARTSHHRHQHRRHWGRDFGSRYECNRHYGAGVGPSAKDSAHSEMRLDTKAIIDVELKELDDFNASGTWDSFGIAD